MLDSASLVPALESFLCSMVELGGILAFHHYADVAFFFLIVCVVKVWRLGFFPSHQIWSFLHNNEEKNVTVLLFELCKA